jgi:hypothetical protein
MQQLIFIFTHEIQSEWKLFNGINLKAQKAATSKTSIKIKNSLTSERLLNEIC